MALSREQFHTLARLGAKTRLEELRTEIAAVQALMDGGDANRGRRGRRGRPAGPKRRRRRGKLSAAGRAAISRAQKARWAKIRERKAGVKK